MPKNSITTFTLNPIGYPSADIIELGSQSLYTMFKNQSVNMEVYIDCQMKHGLCDASDGCATYESDFGVSANTDKITTSDYIAARIATFFQAQMNGLTLTGTSRFLECKNKRHNCNTADDDNSCGDNDTCQ